MTWIFINTTVRTQNLVHIKYLYLTQTSPWTLSRKSEPTRVSLPQNKQQFSSILLSLSLLDEKNACHVGTGVQQEKFCTVPVLDLQCYKTWELWEVIPFLPLLLLKKLLSQCYVNLYSHFSMGHHFVVKFCGSQCNRYGVIMYKICISQNTTIFIPQSYVLRLKVRHVLTQDRPS